MMNFQLEYKNELLSHLSNAIKQIQIEKLTFEDEDIGGQKTFTITNESPAGRILCGCLEMIFSHGLKVPKNGFWEAVKQFCRNDLIGRIENQRNVRTNKGKGCYWLSLALNNTDLESYLQSFVMNASEMLRYYHRYAMICSSQICVIQTLISGLDSLTFRLDPDVMHLDFQVKPGEVERVRSTSSIHSVGSRSSIQSTSSEDSLTDKNLGSVVHIDSTKIKNFANDSSKKAVNLVKGLLSGDSLASKKNVFVPMHVMSEHKNFQEKAEADPTVFDNECKKCIANNALICLCHDSPEHKGTPSNTSDYTHHSHDSPNVHPPHQLMGDLPKMKTDTDRWHHRNAVSSKGANPSPRSFKEKRINPFDRVGDRSGDCVSIGNELKQITKRFDQNVVIIDCPIEVIHKSKRKSKSSISSDDAVVTSNHRRKHAKLKSKEDVFSESPILKEDIRVPEDRVFELGDGNCSKVRNEPESTPEVNPGNGDTIGAADGGSMDDAENLDPKQSIQTDQDKISLLQTSIVGKSGLLENANLQAVQDDSNNSVQNPVQENRSVIKKSQIENNCGYFISTEICENVKDAVSETELLENVNTKNYSFQHEEKAFNKNMTSNIYATEDDPTVLQDPITVHDNEEDVPSHTIPVSEKSEDHFNIIETKEVKSDEDKTEVIEKIEGDKVNKESSRTCEFESIAHPAIAEIDNTLRLYLMLEILMDENETIIKFFKLGTGHSEGNWTALYLVFTDCFIYFLKSGDGSCPYQIEHVVRYDNLDYVAALFFAQAMQFVFYETRGIDSKSKKHTARRRRIKVAIDTGDKLLTKLIISTLSYSFSAFASQRDVVKVCPSVFYDAREHKIALEKYIRSEGLAGDVQFYQLVHWEDTNSNADMNSANVSQEGLLDYKSHSGWRSNWKRAYFSLSSGILYQYSTKGAEKPEMCYDLRENNCIGCKRLPTKPGSKIFQFEVLFRHDKALVLQTDSEEVVTDWLQCFCYIVVGEQMKDNASPANDLPSFSNTTRDILVPCSLITSHEHLLLFHEDQLTGFCRTLAKTSSASIKSVNVDVSTQSIEVTASDGSMEPESRWNIFFPCSQAMDSFNSCINSFKTAPTFKTTQDDRSRMHLKEARILLDNRWSRPDNLLNGRDRNKE